MNIRSGIMPKKRLRTGQVEDLLEAGMEWEARKPRISRKPGGNCWHIASRIFL
jgi:hypothetical protein